MPRASVSLLLWTSILLYLTGAVSSVDIQEFFSFGRAQSDRELARGSDAGSALVNLNRSFPFFNQRYKQLRVHRDGVITFGEKNNLLESTSRGKNPLTQDYAAVAAFYAPVFVDEGSAVFYRETQDEPSLERATRHVVFSFEQERDFRATDVFIATWHNVKCAHDRLKKQANTFQLVLITNGEKTFTLFNYEDGGVQWTRGYSVRHGGQRRSAHAQVGFSAGDRARLHLLPGSGESEVALLSQRSNANKAGQWLFKTSWPDMRFLNGQAADSFVPAVTSNIGRFISDQYLKACFKVHGRLPTNTGKVWHDVNVRSCMTICLEGGHKYAALHNGSECACLDDALFVRLERAALHAKCDMPCAANPEETCGGEDAASVYLAVWTRSVQSDDSGSPSATNDVDECEAGTARCFSNSACVNRSPGYCCNCPQGFHGNGITCIKEGVTQRMTGTLSGHVNGQRLDGVRLSVVAITRSGRVDLMVRNPPASLAGSLLLVTPLNDVMSWMFGVTSDPGIPVGYEVMGETFTRNATLTFSSGEVVNLHQTFSARGTLGRYMSTQILLNGRLPAVDPSASVTIEKFQGEYHRTGRGQIESASSVAITLEGNNIGLTVTQVIEFDELPGCGSRFSTFITETSVLIARYDSQRHFAGIAMRTTVEDAETRQPDAQGQEGSEKSCGNGKVTCHSLAVCTADDSGKKQCRCKEGYSGNGLDSCKDVNECNENVCDPRATCENTDGSYSCTCRPGYTGDGQTCSQERPAGTCGGNICHRFAFCEIRQQSESVRCTCRQGFTGTGLECQDLDECDASSDSCHGNAVCRNTLGSFECVCKRGYVKEDRECISDVTCNGGVRCGAHAVCDRFSGCICLRGFQGDGHSCHDVDECNSDVRRCDLNADCKNTAGSFECRCKQGFVGDGLRCTMADGVCNGVTCDQNARCVQQSAGQRHQCICNEGWQGDGQTCSVDESCGGRECHQNATCLDTPTGLRCECNEGYQGDGVECADFDECGSQEEPRCHANAACLNTVGSFECRCESGFQGNGLTCSDIDECKLFEDTCDRNAECQNTAGSFQCVCKPGYQGNGYTCSDVNECEPFRNKCHAEADCLNSAGSYTCRCRPGFQGDGVNCSSDGTCDGVRCHANARCVRSPGKRQRHCECELGWQGDGKTCRDVNECLSEQSSKCDPNADCLNTEGSYSCRCKPGYEGDGISCKADGTCAGTRCHHGATCQRNTRCVCKPGYHGDGRTCSDIDECSTSSHDCHKEAECTNTIGSYDCKCRPGFAGSGRHCQPDGTCAGVLCHSNAKCVASPEGNRVCQCRAGFVGNGRACSDINECALGLARCPDQADCVNRLGSFSCTCRRGYVMMANKCISDGTCDGHACHFNAICVDGSADNKDAERRCRCKPGFTGNGLLCTDLNECDLDSVCPAKSACFNTAGSFFCRCHLGYQMVGKQCKVRCRRCLNGGTCTGVSDCLCPPGFSGKRCQWYGDAFLVFTKGNSVQRMSLPPRPNNVAPIHQRPGAIHVAVDYDCVEEHVYWSEVTKGVISRAKYDGSQKQAVLKNLGSPEGVAVDWMGRNIYWTDSLHDVIEVARLDGSDRKVLISSGLMDPRAIALDPQKGKMYWSDWVRYQPKIEVANMDGSNRRVLVKSSLGLPNGLTLVQSTNELCFTDAGTWSIRCVSLSDLSMRKVLQPAPYPFGITSFNRTLFWTDWMVGSIQRIGLTAERPGTPLSSFRGNTGKIFGIKGVQKCSRSAVDNPCAVGNGGCPSLCLLRPGGYSCSCRKGRQPVQVDGVTKCELQCGSPLGMENGLIPDAQLAASSAWRNNSRLYGAQRARLKLAAWPEGWNAAKNDLSPWLQLEFEHEKTITAVATQGFGNKNTQEWVRTYALATSEDGVVWRDYTVGNKVKVFVGNSDRARVVRNELKDPLTTRWLRFLPRTWNNHIAMRVEVYGC